MLVWKTLYFRYYEYCVNLILCPNCNETESTQAFSQDYLLRYIPTSAGGGEAPPPCCYTYSLFRGKITNERNTKADNETLKQFN